MTASGSTLLFGAIPVQLKVSAPEKRALAKFAGELVARVAGGRTFVCMIAGDRELRRLNAEFLGNDYPTDVLSFPSLQLSGDLGEMAISIERAEAQALEFGHTRLDEIRILMLHGLLHLTGLDHEADRGEMARAERQWRGEFNLSKTLIARSKVLA